MRIFTGPSLGLKSKRGLRTQTVYGRLHAGGDVTAADELRDHRVELAQLGVLVLDGGSGTFIQSDQHERGRDVQLQQLRLLCQAWWGHTNEASNVGHVN